MRTLFLQLHLALKHYTDNFPKVKSLIPLQIQFLRRKELSPP